MYYNTYTHYFVIEIYFKYNIAMYKGTIVYETNEKNLLEENGEKYIGYEVDCFEIENGFKRLVKQVIDTSVNLYKIQGFVYRLNELKLSPEHLYDAVNDFVCEGQHK